LEQAFHGKIDLRRNLRFLKLQSKELIFSLQDMKDYQEINYGKFTKKFYQFNLKQALEEVLELVKFKSEII